MPPPHEQSANAADRKNVTRRRRRTVGRSLQKLNSANAIRANPASKMFLPFGEFGTNGTSKEAVRAVVVMEALKGVGWPPETLTCAGEIAQVDAGIGSTQDIASVPENPLMGAACKLKVAVSPAVIVTDVDPLEPSAN